MSARPRATGPNSIYMSPDRPAATLEDLTALVRIPGQPSKVRAFTTAEIERGDADQYASEHGGSVISLAIHSERSAEWSGKQ